MLARDGKNRRADQRETEKFFLKTVKRRANGGGGLPALPGLAQNAAVG